MKRSLMTACFAALAVGAALARAQAAKPVRPPPNPAGEGPSLEVTMRFIQDKLNSQGEVTYSRSDGVGPSAGRSSHWTQLTKDAIADPTSCTLKATLEERTVNGHTFSYLQVGTMSASFQGLTAITVQDHGDSLRTTRAYQPVVTPPVFELTIKAQEVPFKSKQALQFRVAGAPSGADYFKGVSEAIVTFVFRNEDTANRVANAMVRAQNLCGSSTQSADEQAPPLPPDSNYFPMSVGAEWNYKVSTFVPQPQTDESSLFLLSRSQDAEGINFEEGSRMASSNTWRLSQKGIEESTPGGTSLLLLAFPLTAGKIWSQTVSYRCRGCDTGPPDSVIEYTFRVLTIGQACSPAGGGAYDRCLLIEMTKGATDFGKSKSELNYVPRTITTYAYGVGPVDYEVFHDTPGNQTLVSSTKLAEFEIDMDQVKLFEGFPHGDRYP
jgi:hypothetical protein